MLSTNCFNYLLCVFTALGSAAPALAIPQTPTSASKPILKDNSKLAISLALVKPGKPNQLDLDQWFRVKLVNRGDKPLSIYHPLSKEGYDQWTLHFRNKASGETTIARRSGVKKEPLFNLYTEEDPEPGITNLAPGQTLTFDISLTLSDSQKWRGLPNPNSGELVEFFIQLDSAKSPAGEKDPNWIGQTASPPLEGKLSSPALTTPQKLIWYGFAEAAIEIMKKNKKLIASVDEGGFTPLMRAVQWNHLELIEWLLANGANVNARIPESISVIHLADEPRLMKVILQYKPDLTIESGEGTPLESAAKMLAIAWDEETRKNWLENIELLRAAGAKDSLKTAIYLNDIEASKRFIKELPDAARKRESETALRIAAEYGRLEICQALLEIPNLDVDQSEGGSAYPIVFGALKHPKVVKLLIAHGADVKKRITYTGDRPNQHRLVEDDATLLHHAAVRGVPETITLLIDNGVEIFAVPNDDWPDFGRPPTALEVASLEGKGENALAIVLHPKFAIAPEEIRQKAVDQCLLSLAESDSQTGEDLGPVFPKLIQAGANPNGRNAIRVLAGSIYSTSEKELVRFRKMFESLQAAGVEADLASAVQVGAEEFVAARLKSSPQDANQRSDDGTPLLHIAVKMNHPKIVSQLLAAKCDLKLQTKNGNRLTPDGTALHWAAANGRVQITKQLIAAGIDINTQTASGQTALEIALWEGNLKTARLLLENGASLPVKDFELNRPENETMVRELVEEFRKLRKK